MRSIAIFYPHVGEHGGIERNIIALADSISARGLEALLVCFYDRVGLANPNLRVVQLGDHWNPFVKARRVRKWVDEHRDSIVGMPLFFGCKAGFYAAMGNVSQYALHYTDPPSLLSGSNEKRRWGVAAVRSRISEYFRKKGVTRADRRITMTKWNAEELRSLFERDFEVIYQGGVPPRSSPSYRPRCQGNSMRWFSICRLADSKHLDWILHAGRRIVDAKAELGVEDFQIVIAGQGPALDSLRRVASELQIDAYVQFPGFLTEEEVEMQFHQADLSLVPARQGFGLPVLESLYRRIPVVLNRESRVSELLGSNPWVRISDHSMEGFSKAVYEFTVSLRKNGMPSEVELRDLPTEANWADKLGVRCGWWSEGGRELS